MSSRSILTLIVLATPCLAAEPKPLSGWPGVFPELTGYAVQFQAPTAGKDRTKEYRQTAHYEWTGGDIRMLTVTLARGAEFKKAPEGAERVEAGKRPGWFKDGVLTVPLGEDRGVQFKGGGSVAEKEGILPLAEKFNFARIAKALENPPRTDFRRSVEPFRSVTKGMTFAELSAWAGDADADIGSGIHVMLYKLPGGGRVLVGTPDFVKLLYIKHESKDGKKEDLLR